LPNPYPVLGFFCSPRRPFDQGFLLSDLVDQSSLSPAVQVADPRLLGQVLTHVMFSFTWAFFGRFLLGKSSIIASSGGIMVPHDSDVHLAGDLLFCHHLFLTPTWYTQVSFSEIRAPFLTVLFLPPSQRNPISAPQSCMDSGRSA